MIATARAATLRNLQRDREKLIRLFFRLLEVIASNGRFSGSHTPIFETRKKLESEIRSLAAGLVCQIEAAIHSQSLDMRNLERISRSTSRSFEQIANQMYPESVDRFVMKILAHHLDTLNKRVSVEEVSIVNSRATRLSSRPIQREASYLHQV